LKVVHVIDHLGLGGSQTLMLDLLEARGPRVDASVWTLTDRVLEASAARLESAGIRCASLGIGMTNPSGLIRLRSRMATERPDLVHTHLDFSNALGAIAALSLGQARPKVVCQIENDPSRHYHAVSRLLLHLVAPWVDAHIVISPSLARAMRPTLGGRARRIELIQPGIDVDRFEAPEVDAEVVRGFRDGATRVVGMVGRLAEQKGIDVLLAATPRLLSTDAGTRILIVGEGPERAKLENRARDLGVAAAVRFVGHRDDVASVYRAMDVFVLPSRHEGFGLVFAEAMAAGVPVVGTRVVGSVDAVMDGETGLLTAPGDPEGLAHAVLRLFAEPDLRCRLIENGRSWVRRKCSRDTMSALTEALYERLRDEPPPQQGPS
jgi:glycosyltransferase involved in cell wall biosynthesis